MTEHSISCPTRTIIVILALWHLTALPGASQEPTPTRRSAFVYWNHHETQTREKSTQRKKKKNRSGPTDQDECKCVYCQGETLKDPELIET